MDRAALRFCELVVGAPGAGRGRPAGDRIGFDRRRKASPTSRLRIPVRAGRVGALLGTKLQDAELGRLLDPLGFVTRSSGRRRGTGGLLEVGGALVPP